MSPRFKVLWMLAAASSSISMVGAQPPDATPSVTIVPDVAPAAAPVELPLLPMKLEDFLARHGGLSRLTLKMNEATADEIADEIKKQTGIVVVPVSGLRGVYEGVQRFSVEAMGQPFWEAVYQWNRGERTLYIERLEEDPSRWELGLLNWWQEEGRDLVVGPCLMRATHLRHYQSRDRRLSTKAPPVTEVANYISLQTAQRFDPKFSPLIAAVLTEVEGGVDDRGRAILPNNNAGYPMLPEDQTFVRLDLQGPEADAKVLKSVKGTLRLATISRQERWEIDLAVTPKTEKSFKSAESEVTIGFDGLNIGHFPSAAKFHLQRKTFGPKRLFKSRSPQYVGMQIGEYQDTARAIHVFNSEGEPLKSSFKGTTSNEKDGIRTFDIEVTVERDPANKDVEKSLPAKIIIDVPLEYREIQIPFEFKDVPLP